MTSESQPPSPSPAGPLADCVARARRGDEAAIHSLLLYFNDRVSLYIRARLGPAARDFASVEDVLQETFSEALGSLENYSYASEATLLAWFCKIAENQIRDVARRANAQKRAAPGAREPWSAILDRARRSATGPATAAGRVESRAQLANALDRLADDERQAVLLRFFAGQQYTEIADALGRSETAARRLVAKATLQLGFLLKGGLAQ